MGRCSPGSHKLGSYMFGGQYLGGYSRGGSSVRGYNQRCCRTRQNTSTHQKQALLHQRSISCTFVCISSYRTCVRTLG